MNDWIELNCINQTQPATRRTHKQRRRRRTMENQQRMPTRVTLPINAAIQQTSFLSWCCVTLFALERCWVRFCGHHIALLWSCSFGFPLFRVCLFGVCLFGVCLFGVVLRVISMCVSCGTWRARLISVTKKIGHFYCPRKIPIRSSSTDPPRAKERERESGRELNRIRNEE